MKFYTQWLSAVVFFTCSRILNIDVPYHTPITDSKAVITTLSCPGVVFSYTANYILAFLIFGPACTCKVGWGNNDDSLSEQFLKGPPYVQLWPRAPQQQNVKWHASYPRTDNSRNPRARLTDSSISNC